MINFIVHTPAYVFHFISA